MVQAVFGPGYLEGQRDLVSRFIRGLITATIRVIGVTNLLTKTLQVEPTWLTGDLVDQGDYRSYIGDIGIYWGYIGIMENKMEITIVYWISGLTLRIGLACFGRPRGKRP